MQIIQIPSGASVTSVGGFPPGPGDVSYEDAQGAYRVAHIPAGAVVKWGDPKKMNPVHFRGPVAPASALTRAVWDGYALIAEVERRSQYEATLRGLALSPCECVEGQRGNGMSCLSCAACRILVRADARVSDGVPL